VIPQKQDIQKSPAGIAAGKVASGKTAPKLDLCTTCFDFMDQFMDQLLNAILQAGIGGGCGGICTQLPESAEQLVCEMLCMYVGVEAFASIVEYEDPDPVFVCQVIDICPVVDNGAAKITSAFVTPTRGPQGTTFNMVMQYKVLNATGPGYLAVQVSPPDGMPFGGSQFTTGQAVGSYQLGWQLQAEPDENEDFSPGFYEVDFAVCEGDCTNAHKWGGIYAEASSGFNITA